MFILILGYQFAEQIDLFIALKINNLRRGLNSTNFAVGHRQLRQTAVS